MITISVVIATYNRCEDLRQTLESLQKQDLREDVHYEIIIVDNNSKDKTKDVVESFIPSFQGKLKYLFESRQGQPFAHNYGIKEAKGEIVVLTDDDCTFNDDYLSIIYDTFDKNGSNVGFIGGKVGPRFVNCSKPEWFDDLDPEWFKEFFWGPLAILDYGNKPFMIENQKSGRAPDRLFYGANMAVRKETFLKCGDFDVNRTVSQDTELQERFLKNGVLGLYVPEIKVFHKVTADRLSPQYYHRWYYSRGFYRKIQKTYSKKFYHPFGIQIAWIIGTIKLFINSAFERSFTKRLYFYCDGLFNLGQMAQIIKKNTKTDGTS